MWPFKRQQSEDLDAVPPEVQQYYQAEKRERAGVAWLLAFATLFVTTGLVLGLFFGGRVIYRRLAHKNKPTTTATVQKAPSTQSAATPQKPTDSSKSANSGAAVSTPTANQPSSSPDTSAPALKSGSVAAPTAPSTQSTKLTNTGPGDIALAGFIVASFLGVGLYQWRLRHNII